MKKEAPKLPQTTREKEQAGRNAREWTARNYKRHLEKQGGNPSYSEVKAYVDKRADRLDRKG